VRTIDESLTTNRLVSHKSSIIVTDRLTFVPAIFIIIGAATTHGSVLAVERMISELQLECRHE